MFCLLRQVGKFYARLKFVLSFVDPVQSKTSGILILKRIEWEWIDLVKLIRHNIGSIYYTGCSHYGIFHMICSTQRQKDLTYKMSRYEALLDILILRNTVTRSRLRIIRSFFVEYRLESLLLTMELKFNKFIDSARIH